MTILSLVPPSSFGTGRLTRASGAVPGRYMDPGIGSAACARLSLDLVTTRAAFEALEADWTDLFSRAGRSEQVFQSFGWLWQWCRHFLDPADRKLSLAIVTGRRHGRLVLACPFMVAAGKGVCVLTFMGDPVSQYGDVLIEPGTAAEHDLKAAFDFVLERTRVDAVQLRKVRGDAHVAPLLGAHGAVITEKHEAPHIAFDGVRSYADFEQRYPKSARKNRKRQMRRLQETGETSFVRLAPGEDTPDAVSLALRLKRDWLRQRGLVSAAITDPRTERFFRDCASGKGPATGVEIAFVRSSGEVAAIEISIACKDRVAVHLIAYDPRFEKTGAGALLMEDSIRKACEEGKSTVDLLAPGAAYKFEWADRATGVGDYALGLSTKGTLYAAAYLARLRPAAKALHEHLPAVLRRYLALFLGAGLLIGDRGGVT